MIYRVAVLGVETYFITRVVYSRGVTVIVVLMIKSVVTGQTICHSGCIHNVPDGTHIHRHIYPALPYFERYSSGTSAVAVSSSSSRKALRPARIIRVRTMYLYECMCALHMKLLFAPIDIQHNHKRPCRMPMPHPREESSAVTN